MHFALRTTKYREEYFVADLGNISQNIFLQIIGKIMYHFKVH